MLIVSVTDTGLFNKKEGRFIKKLITFENSDIQVIQINDVWHFELYSVGMALGQVVSAKGNVYPNKTRIDKNVKNAEIKPVLRNAKLYITEEQVYDLMLETRTDKCRVFRKWLTNEVLPVLNHTGKYEMQKPDPKPYEYFDKTYNGEPVLTPVDIENLTGISRNNTDYQAKHNFNNGKDYFLLVKNELKKFKLENPKVNRLASSIMIITQNGFKKLCNIYGVQVEKLKCFEEKVVKAEIPKLLNEKQARELFEKECILMDNHDVILYERVAELFGENVAEHAKDEAFRPQLDGKHRPGIYYNCRGANCDIQYFTINGFFKAITYSNISNIRRVGNKS